MLTFNLKKEWFEKIKSGEKTHEYREVKPYWDKRLKYQKGGERKFSEHIADFYITKEKGIKEGSIISFTCGYPNKKDKTKILHARVLKGLTIINGLNTDLKINKSVYDIEFELLEDK